jgi:MobA/MobL family
MAIYHLSASIVKRSAGRSVTAAAAYRAGAKIEDITTGIVHDYTRKKGVDYSEIISPIFASLGSEWLIDRQELWNKIEEVEKRKDAQLAREITLALPVELPRNQQIALVREYVQINYVAAGMVADVNLHHLDGDNPHAHILLTMRNLQITPEGTVQFTLKNTDWNSKELLLSHRKSWEEITNKYLANYGSDIKIDCRSLKDQGSEFIPQIHVGVHAMAMKRKGIATDRSEEYDRIQSANNDIRANLERIYEEEAAPKSELTQPYHVDESIEERDRKLGEISFELTKNNKSFVKFQSYTLKQHHQKYIEVRVDGGAKILDLKQEDEKWNISINYPKNTVRNYSENYVDGLVQHFEDCIRNPHNLAKNQESRNQIEKDRNRKIEQELLQNNDTAKSIQKLLNLYDEKGRTFYPLRFEINKKADKIKVFDRWQGSRNHETIYEFYLVDNNWQKFLGNKRGIIPIHNLDTRVKELINQVNQVTDLKSVSYAELSNSQKEQITRHYAKNGDLQDSYRVRYNKPDYTIEASRKMLEDGWDSEIVKSIFNNQVEKELEPVTTLLEKELAVSESKEIDLELQIVEEEQIREVAKVQQPTTKKITKKKKSSHYL